MSVRPEQMSRLQSFLNVPVYDVILLYVLILTEILKRKAKKITTLKDSAVGQPSKIRGNRVWTMPLQARSCPYSLKGPNTIFGIVA